MQYWIHSAAVAVCALILDSTTAQEPASGLTPPPAPSKIDVQPGPSHEPIVTDRPDFTESTSVVPYRRVQLEGGYTFTYDRAGDRRTRDHAFPEFLLRAGLATDWELRIGWDGFSLTEDIFHARNDAGRRATFHEHDDAATDMSVGFKAHLLAAAGLVPELSVIGGLSLPAGSTGKSSGDVDPELKLLWGYGLSEPWSLSGNVNFASQSDDAGRLFQNSASVSLGFALSDFVGTYVEYFGFYPNARDRDCAHYLNGGFTFPVTPDFQLDLRAGFGLNNEADDMFAGVGFAFRF